ncbi:C2 family cysteine protease [uncultured Bacteroides sp.]|nr:C2 family cysteine protease [uncultured Bacteroides sp.]
MVDADADTKYTTGHNAFSIVWNGDQRAAVSSYSLTSAAESAGKDPKSWTLSASNDNKIWITLDSKEGETFKERKETRVFHIENATAYKYYKLDIKDNHGSTQTQIAEWTLNQEEAIINIDDLIERHGSGFTYSDSNPMGTQYENKHTTTKQDREWLANPANEPLLLPDTPGLTQFKEFSVNLYPFGDPVPADVNQYAIGDCWALAIFASFAYQCPDFIKSIITKNADNTFTVRMFDPQGERVDVCIKPTFLADASGNIGAVTGKRNVPTWATVLEKAMMKWKKIYQVNPDINGIGGYLVSPMFTGAGGCFAFDPGKFKPAELERVAKACLQQRKIAGGGFNVADLPAGPLTTVTYHAFTLMHSADPDALFSMRNPWGVDAANGDKVDGVLNIYDDGVVPPTVDFSIIEPGIAINYMKKNLGAYIPPRYSYVPIYKALSYEVK